MADKFSDFNTRPSTMGKRPQPASFDRYGCTCMGVTPGVFLPAAGSGGGSRGVVIAVVAVAVIVAAGVLLIVTRRRARPMEES